MNLAMNKSSTLKSNSLEQISILMTNFNKGSHLSTIIELSDELLLRGAELVIVDDGSTDGSYEKLLDFSHRNESVVLVTQTNQGSAISRNRAIQLATRRFLAFLDFDDFISVTVLEHGLSKLLNSEAKIAILNYEIDPGKNRNLMPILVDQPEVIRLENNRNDFFRSMGYWRYLYSKEFILDQKIRFSPSFDQVGGLFILDDLFWLLHILSLEIDILTFPDDLVLYSYKTSSPSQSDRYKYQLQVMLFPKAMSVFIAQLLECEHSHDLRWLGEMLPKVTVEHLKFLTFTQLIRTIPSYLSLVDSSAFFQESHSLSANIKVIATLLYRCLKNSIIRFEIMKTAIKYFRGA